MLKYPLKNNKKFWKLPVHDFPFTWNAQMKMVNYPINENNIKKLDINSLEMGPHNRGFQYRIEIIAKNFNSVL